MKKSLSNSLCILAFLSMLLPSSTTAFAAGSSNTTGDATINITNNASSADIIIVTGLANGDIVKVYSSAKDGTEIGTATVKEAGVATVSINQIGTSAGNVYISVKRIGLIESAKIKRAYAAEVKSVTPEPTAIIVTNNAAGTKDAVVVQNLFAGDIINVYSESTAGVLLGTGTAKTDGDLTINIEQIGSESGSVYVSLTIKTLLESDRTTAVTYASEVKSTPLDPEAIVVTNNAAGTKDAVVVQDLFIGDIINVYSASTSGVLLGTGTAKTDGDLTISIEQIGAESGNVYVSVTSKTLLESDRTPKVPYVSEVKSTTPDLEAIVVTNNAVGTNDTVVVENLDIGDIINVYSASTAGVLLGTGTLTVAGDLTVSIAQIGAAGGKVYVSVIEKTFLESDRTIGITYTSEVISTLLDPTAIVVTNNAVGTADTVMARNLDIGDIVKVYSSATDKVVIGTATATEGGDLTVSIRQIGVAGGKVYVSVIRKTFLESYKKAVTFNAESKSEPIYISDIVVTNNAVRTADTVLVRDLAIGDKIKVYSLAKGGAVIGSATATVSGDLIVSISQIGATAGNIYVSVKRKAFLESDRTVAIKYASETKSTALRDSNIVVINNSAGTVGRVLVQYLAIGDIIKIYSLETGGVVIGTATATDTGDLMISINQEGVASGSIYVSVTRKTFLESDRIKAVKIFW
ncbi:MAG: hypothetical protein ACI8WT_004485 [Clostridium sp.]|jgi:uncharacterized protein (DUF2141 family)